MVVIVWRKILKRIILFVELLSTEAARFLSANLADQLVAKTEKEEIVSICQELGERRNELEAALQQGKKGQKMWNKVLGGMLGGERRKRWVAQVSAHPDVVFFYALCGSVRNYQQSEMMTQSFVEKVLMNTHGKASDLFIY